MCLMKTALRSTTCNKILGLFSVRQSRSILLFNFLLYIISTKMKAKLTSSSRQDDIKSRLYSEMPFNSEPLRSMHAK